MNGDRSRTSPDERSQNGIQDASRQVVPFDAAPELLLLADTPTGDRSN